MNQPKVDLYSAALDGRWVKSSYSNGSGSDCVRLMRLAGGVAIGDSKSPERAPLRCTYAELRSFLDHLVRA
ncbi:DUF397 domain-containing protein [Streptomyces sp. NPDC127098]|uniref:DUF397 domain-containing protein n=1 Tax=Streptomyces sp. NPDC127098 TaxID=3347137 RepID=UPI003669F2EF